MPLLTHICRISGHPLTQYPREIKERYVCGLGSVLHKVSNGDLTMKMLFEQWGVSILGNLPRFQYDGAFFIKRAISLNRVGFRFFRLKHQFYFDCFYLTEMFNRALIDKLYELLKAEGCSCFTKKSLANTYKFFASRIGQLKVEDALLLHRTKDRGFNNRYCTKILVVATVSAGKSTLINALTGHTFNRVMTGACTSRNCRIWNKRVPDGITIAYSDHLGYDSNPDSHSSDETSEIAFNFNSFLRKSRICLIDTPGVNNSFDVKHGSITSEAIESGDYDYILFISNGQYNGTCDERRLLELLRSKAKAPVLFVLNQLDRFSWKEDDIMKMINDYRRELQSIGFKSPKVFPISAQFAYLLRREDSLDEDEQFELELMRKRFGKKYYDLQSYVAAPSKNELEKSGIIFLEKEILKLLK